MLLVTARQSKASSFAEQLQAWPERAAGVLGFAKPDVLSFERLRTLHVLSGAFLAPAFGRAARGRPHLSR